MNISPLPKVPQRIIEAINNEKLAIFIGAGVSRLIGCKSWNKLAQNLIERCYTIKNKNGSSLINFKEKESLEKYDPKKIITICHYLLKNSNFEDVFYEEMDNALEADKKLIKVSNIYKEIFSLGGVFITTNADEHFDNMFVETRVIYKENDFKSDNIEINKLYHIHGSIKEKSSLVFTTPQYIKRYNNEDFKNFLETIFEKFTILFIGYGLAEFELLDFLVTKYDNNEYIKELKHFILMPFYKGEENILKFEQHYYNTMGIQVIPYAKDEKGYSQLYDVIKHWSKEIRQQSNILYNIQEKIEQATNQYNENEEETIFQIIKNDKNLENYFFKKLSLSSNPISWLKPLKNKGYFNPENNPKPKEIPDNKGYFTIPYWDILLYLKNVAEKNEETPSEETTDILLNIIDSIINFKDKDGKRVDNYHTDLAIIDIIFSLPIEKIDENHIKFIREVLNSKWNTANMVTYEIYKSVLPKLIAKEAREIILKLLNVILDYKKMEEKILDKKTFKYKSIMDEYLLNELFKKYNSKIAKLCGIEAAKIAISKIKSILKENDKSKFNLFWIYTIEDNQNLLLSKRYEKLLTYFVIDMFKFSNPKKIKEEIRSLLNEKHPIFKRIAIYIINHHYKDLHQLFWNWSQQINPLEEKELKHELYELFQNNCIDFSDEQINKILDWIESKKYYIEDIKNDKNLLAYKKKEWLSSLLKTEKSNVTEAYNKYNQISPEEIEHKGYDVWIGEFNWEKEETLSIKKEFLNKSNEEIAKYFAKLPKKNEFSNALIDITSENPEKFSNNLQPFLKVQRIYQYALLAGFNKAWQSQKEINWEAIFDFISKIISEDKFWNDENYERGYNYKNWIIDEIAELIKNGTKNDEYAFNPKFLPNTEEILLNLIEKTKSNPPDLYDLVNSVLNSTKGKIFAAMVNYSLRYARLYKKEDNEKWPINIKNYFTKNIQNRANSSLEFSVILGEYLLNLYWLDKQWVINNINKIFPQNSEGHWKATFTGYLFYSNINKDIYFLLKKNGHYFKAIETDFSDSHILERLIEHICIGYIEDWEELDKEDSLISQLIENKNIDQLLEIVSFFWGFKNTYFEEKIKEKVKPIWKKLYELAKQNKEDKKYHRLISHLSLWLSLIDTIDDETFEYLKFSAKFVNVDFNTQFFIEYLLEHSSKTPKKVGEIYLEMLDANIYPTFEKDNIEKIVKTLYENKEKDIANRICNLYFSNGYEFLREIYKKNNKI